MASYEPETRLYIAGSFVTSVSGRTFDLFDPYTQKPTYSVYEANADDVDKAVKAAKVAFPTWSCLSAAERGSYLFKLADALEKALPQLSYFDAINMGKPVHFDVLNSKAIEVLRYYAGKALDVAGDSSLNSAGMLNLTLRQPYGVCGAIIPWNSPVLALALKVGPGLVCGNTIVLKTSEKAPLSCSVVAKCCEEIGLPAGVLNILHGFGQPCGEAIATHMEVRKISFTGSTATGRAISRAAANSNLKNVTLELGGKSPLIVFEDADVEKAAAAAALSILMNSGQACIASSRFYVHKSIRDKFVASLEAIMVKTPAGNPLHESTMRGPQADGSQFARALEFLNYARKNGFDIKTGGGRDGTQGYLVQGTLILDPPEDSRLMKEEIFGPVACVCTFEDEEEVLMRANDCDYGLYASVFTADISRALRIAKRFEAGSVGVNCTSPTLAMDMPLGGWKSSGTGKEYSKYALEAWTEMKSVFISL